MGAALAASADDLDLLGTSLSAYAKNVVDEVVCVGCCGTLVDWEQEGQQRAALEGLNLHSQLLDFKKLPLPGGQA